MVMSALQKDKQKSFLENCHTSGVGTRMEGKRTRSYFRCSIARIYLHARLLSLLPQPADKVPQPHDVITMIYHRQTFTQKNHTNNRSSAEF